MKEKLNLRIVSEMKAWRREYVFCLIVSFYKEILLRKPVAYKFGMRSEHMQIKEIDKMEATATKDLFEWFERMVIEPTELTPAQQKRLAKLPPHDISSRNRVIVKYLKMLDKQLKKYVVKTVLIEISSRGEFVY